MSGPMGRFTLRQRIALRLLALAERFYVRAFGWRMLRDPAKLLGDAWTYEPDEDDDLVHDQVAVLDRAVTTTKRRVRDLRRGRALNFPAVRA